MQWIGWDTFYFTQKINQELPPIYRVTEQTVNRWKKGSIPQKSYLLKIIEVYPKKSWQYIFASAILAKLYPDKFTFKRYKKRKNDTNQEKGEKYG
jgi:hypothetical protein